MKFKSGLRYLGFIASRFRKLGTELSYAALLMYYAFQSDGTPTWAKRIIIGALAYMLSPFDSIPDLTPVLGFTDDLGVISFGLVSIACYINNDIRNRALATLEKFFGKPNEDAIRKIDAIL